MSNRIGRDDEKLFTDLCEVYRSGNIKKYNLFTQAIQAFMEEPSKILQKRIQAVAVSTDVARQNIVDFNVTLATDNFDMNYEKAFRIAPLSQYQQGWQIYNVTNSLTFVKVAEGERIEVSGIKGTRTTAYVDKYGGAIGWTDELIRFNQIAAMVDMALIFRNKFWKNKADNHYALLSAAAAVTGITAYDTVQTGQLRKDIATINQACYDLANALKDKGYGDMGNAEFLIYANPLDQNRIEAAFRAITEPMAAGLGSAQEINGSAAYEGATRRPINRYYSFNKYITQGQPLIVFPQYRVQRADAMQPTTFTAVKDPLTLNELQAVWAYYGAIIADTDQVRAFYLS